MTENNPMTVGEFPESQGHIHPRKILLYDLMMNLTEARLLSRRLWSSRVEGDLDKHIDFFIDLERDIQRKIDHIGNEIA